MLYPLEEAAPRELGETEHFVRIAEPNGYGDRAAPDKFLREANEDGCLTFAHSADDDLRTTSPVVVETAFDDLADPVSPHDLAHLRRRRHKAPGLVDGIAQVLARHQANAPVHKQREGDGHG